MNSIVINIIVPIVLLLYAVPTFLSWGAANPFMKVSAVFAAITGVCAVVGLIMRYTKKNEKQDDVNINTDTDEKHEDINIKDDEE
ncbi:MAG: hypothetical protein LBM59_07290 [Ruminococcus sp.]|jgi:hypothetical protein|nr:hypothetical protein [Ruminococcus sp.]